MMRRFAANRTLCAEYPATGWREVSVVCGTFLAMTVIGIALFMASPGPAFADDPEGLATNDFGNNGESLVPPSAYKPGKKIRESEEYKKENPDANKRRYYEKGGASSNHDSRCRAKIAYKAARYQEPKNGYEASQTSNPDGHKDGPRPKAGGGNYADKMPTDPDTIINNIYKFVEDVTYPKKGETNEEDSDAAMCDLVDKGTIDIGKPLGGGDRFFCKETTHFFTSLVRELGFPVREKNVIPSTGEGTYDWQTAAANVWYGGKWHFFDPWESFKDSKGYLTGVGHAGYGPYHDVDIWVRLTAPKWKIPSDYAADTDPGGDGEPGDTTNWKKIKTHKKNGTKIETKTFVMRLGVQDAFGHITGGATGTPLTEIPTSIYMPHDTLVYLEKPTLVDPPPAPADTYGAEIITLLYAEDEPPAIHHYELMVYNPSAEIQSFEVNLEAMPATVEIDVDPLIVNGYLESGETKTFPFQVTIGDPLVLPPAPVEDLHIGAENGTLFTLEWSETDGATKYDVYANSVIFEDPAEPGVQFLGSTTLPMFDLNVENELIVGVEAVGPTGLTSGLDPDGGSTTLVSVTTKSHLHAEEGLIDLTNPLSTPWHELYPEFCKTHILTSWRDNGDGVLSPCDQIDMEDLEAEKIRYYHVDDVTVTIKVAKKPDLIDTAYVEFEGGFEHMDSVLVNPVCTQWKEVYPVWCNSYHLSGWEDNGDGVLSHCDQIEMTDKKTGEVGWYHVEEVATDVIVSPEEVKIRDAYPTDKNGNRATEFYPGDAIEFHIVYDVAGNSETQYKVKAIISAFGKTYYKTEYRHPGIGYHMIKNKDQGKRIMINGSVPPNTVKTIRYKTKLKDGDILKHTDKATSQVKIVGPDTEIVTVYTSDYSMLPQTQFNPGDKIFYHIFYDIEGKLSVTYTAKGMAKNKQFNVLRALPKGTWLYPDPPTHSVPPGSDYRMIIEDEVPANAFGSYQVKCKVKMKEGSELLDSDMKSCSFYVVE